MEEVKKDTLNTLRFTHKELSLQKQTENDSLIAFKLYIIL